MSIKAGGTAKARPGNTERAPTREHLIETGLDIMRRHGYGASGLQSILDAADVPKGSFYHHFGSKEEFTAAVLDRYVALAGQHSQEVLGNTRQAPLRRLRRYFDDLIRMAGQSAPIQGCLIGNLSLEVAGASQMLQESLSASFTRWQSAVTAVLLEAVEKGDLSKSTQPEKLAGFILNSWEGALLRSQADKSDVPLHDFIHYVFEVMLAEECE